MRRLGTLASRFSPLVLLPCHRSTGSCSSAQKPAPTHAPSTPVAVCPVIRPLTAREAAPFRSGHLDELDWTIIRNETDAPFITSDNPSSVLPRRPFSHHLTRFLPLAPGMALLAVIDPTTKRSGDLPDLDRLPPGRVHRARVTRKQTARLNRVVVMNADELAFGVQVSAPVRRLVRNHREFRVAVEHARLPTPGGGYINGSTVMVRRERPGV